MQTKRESAKILVVEKKEKCKQKNELVQTTEYPSTEDNGSKDNEDMEVEENSKEDSSEEMDTESSSNNE